MTNPWRRASVRLVAAAASALAAGAVVAASVVAAPGHAAITVVAGSAVAGSTLRGAGTGFSPSGDSVEVHWQTATGSDVWSGDPVRNGTISFSFQVPSVAAGDYQVVATQTGKDGDPVPGTPATAPLQVTVAAPSPSPGATRTSPPATGQDPQPQSIDHPAQPEPGDAAAGTVTAPPAPPVSGSINSTSGQPAPGSDPVSNPAAGSDPPPVSSSGGVAPPPSSPHTRPPQVASLWRVGGSVPQAASTAAPASPAVSPPPVTLMVIDGCAMGVAIVIIALALRPQDPPRKQRRPDQGRYATLVSRW